MDLSNLIERLNNELDKLNKLKSDEFDTKDFFTTNEHFNDSPEEFNERLQNESLNTTDNSSTIQSEIKTSVFQDIEPDNETKSLVLVKPSYLVTAQTMFKKTIKFSLKSFLISISLSFLNLFV